METKIKTFCLTVSRKFGAMALRSQKGCVLSFAVLTGILGSTLILKGVSNEDTVNHVSLSQIKTPTDIYMKEKQDSDHLIIVGKLKGEVNGEFEAFYLAVDRNGQLYANHNLAFSEQPSVKSSSWEMISRKQLDYYEKTLHFLPVKGKSLTH